MEGSLKELSQYRFERADYDDFFIASKAEAQTQADNAKVFLENVRAFLAASDVLNS